jgi:CBS domain-containing protein
LLARQLAEPFPAIDENADALEATRLLAERRLPGLIVTDLDGRPRTILAGSQVLRFVIPGYVQDNSALARAYDEAAADKLFAALAGRSVHELLPRERHELPWVDGDATAIEVAVVMARLRSPLVAVIDAGRFVGAITTARLIARMLPSP